MENVIREVARRLVTTLDKILEGKLNKHDVEELYAALSAIRKNNEKLNEFLLEELLNRKNYGGFCNENGCVITRLHEVDGKLYILLTFIDTEDQKLYISFGKNDAFYSLYVGYSYLVTIHIKLSEELSQEEIDLINIIGKYIRKFYK